MLEPTIQLVPASRFTMEELTAAYNQTRVDYLVPMPMNASRLTSYVHIYNIDLDESLVALDGDQMLGLAMLGVRPNHSWVTRLGVLPVRRRMGTGEALVRGLLDATQRLGISRAVLEVIKGNEPAHCLFTKLGFRELRDLLVLRRPPGHPPSTPHWRVDWLDQQDVLDLLAGLPGNISLAWTNEAEAFAKAGDAAGVVVELETGGSGWLVFRRQKFLLSHFIFHTERGNPSEIAPALISHLYQRFPLLDTYVENMPADDPHVASLFNLGFMEIFRRIEMDCVFDRAR